MPRTKARILITSAVALAAIAAALPPAEAQQRK